MDIAGRRFAVIGGAGFIGSHVVGQLLAADAGSVLAFDDMRRGSPANLAAWAADPRLSVATSSMTDPGALRRAIDGVDGVFLLAALWLDECARDPRRAWEVNVIGTWNVVEACRDAGSPRIVFSSSASVYGNAETVPMTEDHPLSNRTMYGGTKIAGEQMLRAAAAGWGQPFLGLRYMNVYGPRMDDRGAYVSVIVRMLERLDRDDAPIVYGDGSQTFDFVHVGDVARSNLLAMASVTSDEFLNIGTGVGTTVSDLAARLISMAGSSKAPRYEQGRSELVTTRIGSTTKASTVIDFDARIGLDEGLRDVVRWWRSRRATSGVSA